MMSKTHWLALAATPGIGGATARRLIERFGSVDAVFDAAPDDLAALPRVSLATAEQLLQTSLDPLADDIASLSDEGIELLTWDDEPFPAPLRALSDAPVLLFVRGELRAGDQVSAAIVGTREASDDRLALTERVARGLAERGIPIVSGLALGIDTAAHWGALQAEGGRTVALLGSGIRVIHPRENADLAAQVQASNATLRETEARLRETVEALALPLIPLDGRVALLPLVGHLDDRRAERLIAGLLEGIHAQRARAVVVDITGLRDVDERAASALVQAASAARLLGAEVVLSGISAETAQALVNLGGRIGELRTAASLSAALRSLSA